MTFKQWLNEHYANTPQASFTDSDLQSAWDAGAQSERELMMEKFREYLIHFSVMVKNTTFK